MAESPKIEKFRLRPKEEVSKKLEATTHIYHCGARCETDSRGHSTPRGRSPLELVLDASNGFVPLWDMNVTLLYRFQEQSLAPFQDPEAVKNYVREIFGEALLSWGPSVPVKFAESKDLWDFEIVVRDDDNCNMLGCTLARAFFPDAGQHELVLFPRMFEQDRVEQIETLVHELGHVFGLRHFFAQVSETAFPSEVFGKHEKFSIMNYGEESTLTKTDISDLIALYEGAWSGKLTNINGTPINLVQPYSHLKTLLPSASFFAMKRRSPFDFPLRQS